MSLSFAEGAGSADHSSETGISRAITAAKFFSDRSNIALFFQSLLRKHRITFLIAMTILSSPRLFRKLHAFCWLSIIALLAGAISAQATPTWAESYGTGS